MIRPARRGDRVQCTVYRRKIIKTDSALHPAHISVSGIEWVTASFVAAVPKHFRLRELSLTAYNWCTRHHAPYGAWLNFVRCGCLWGAVRAVRKWSAHFQMGVAFVSFGVLRFSTIYNHCDTPKSRCRPPLRKWGPPIWRESQAVVNKTRSWHIRSMPRDEPAEGLNAACQDSYVPDCTEKISGDWSNPETRQLGVDKTLRGLTFYQCSSPVG